MKLVGQIDIYEDPEDDNSILLELSSFDYPNLDAIEGRGETVAEALESLLEEVYECG